MIENVEDDFARYTFTVYPPPTPGLPWLSVCIGPDGYVLDSEAFHTGEEADTVTQKAQEVLLDSIMQKHRPPADAVMH
ncbi:hypothetical protein [Methylobacterium soli]|uniref:Uncharacterized protein n=1 Tax=Methylobacterium soli TaxID=553447 RepID=A0A6L3T246_9HYPH|nr:hypothetical protein [Methylobacterium soli]KAB1077147.1 hypothetical protein F6X53_19875 [Methylobacterium soli]GJE43911.1 hypothetical protein AEGHOMDF_3091 [Methylobacterium soli]